MIESFEFAYCVMMARLLYEQFIIIFAGTFYSLMRSIYTGYHNYYYKDDHSTKENERRNETEYSNHHNKLNNDSG